MERDKERQSQGGLHLGARTSMLPYELESRIDGYGNIGGTAAGPWHLPVGVYLYFYKNFLLTLARSHPYVKHDGSYHL